MKRSTIDLLNTQASEWLLKGRILATDSEIEEYEAQIEKIHPSYIPYLREAGYETVGAEYFDRLKDLKENQEKGKSYKSPASKGKMKECFIFHWDGCGNPVGVSWKDNKVYVDDDVYGNGMELNESIDDYVIELLNDE